MLKHVGNLFTGRVRKSDTVARTGGDEFSVILEEPMTRADALRVGGALMQLLDEPFTFGDQKVRVGASVGIAVFPDDAADAESLQIAADLRMYAGKNAARETVGENIAKPFPVKSAPVPRPKQGLQTAE